MKFAKLSLVAAVAVAGFTTANAQPLEEAIKNVDVTGSAVYRYNEYTNDKVTAPATSDNLNQNNYKIALGLASKVNDDVKFNSRFIVGSTSDAGWVTLDSNGADGQASVTLSNANFAYTGIKNTTVIAGKQGLTTPWTVAVQADGNEQTGTGILALSALGPVTLAGGYFNQTNVNASSDSSVNGVALYKADRNKGTSTSNTGVSDLTASTIVGNDVIDGQQDIAVVGAIATLGPVTADAWYLTLNNTFNTYTVGAKNASKLAGVDVTADARYASLTLDKNVAKALQPVLSANSSIEDNNSIIKLVVTADAGLIDGKVAYAKTGKEGGLTALDNDASTTLLGWNLTANGKADADYWQAVVGIDILPNLNLSANYGNVQYKAAANVNKDYEEEEVYGQLLYKMSKNLTTYVRYGTYTKESTVSGVTTKSNDDTRGRLQVAYTF